MSLKALGTMLFALFGASVYFTSFYFGDGWAALIDNMVTIPSFDLTNAVKVIENLQLAFVGETTTVPPAGPRRRLGGLGGFPPNQERSMLFNVVIIM